ncbi:DUF3422 domain-containing protein [Stappia taiwanensis]|uniref:DUF3422 domain-containing protein n=1 Tax=Stappia taiwanensis TaxID=992267 RepID=A0A838XSQ4_9HYPH|nr:DUF3422 domain-containing protein [Stappia taiwanensis]MBA4612091.1 DUF3422 domain-containing protein [Stappia taiwanensis]GGE91172.1 hypothetical protein GCM10007285_18450 [Stappia taiwanensis]
MPDTQIHAAPHIGLPSYTPHPARSFALGEVHARPFRAVSSPRVFLRYGFVVDEEAVVADNAWFRDYCQSIGAQGPDEAVRHHLVRVGDTGLRRELHGEFVTYTWDGPLPASGDIEGAPAGHPFGAGFRPPGPLLVAVRLDLVKADGEAFSRQLERFDHASLAVSEVEDGAAIIASDFRQDGDGLTRMIIGDRSLSDVQAGVLTQRLLELETYRTFAMLGLTEANRQAPRVLAIEQGLLGIADRMRAIDGLDANRTLLDELTRLAADLEAGAAASAYRFGASRAYYMIVRQRLESIDERQRGGSFTFSEFLTRRMAPAMRTCETLEERQANLSRKLARAATLLRTRVDVQLQEQNRGQLEAMNRRARLQLRLQQTVEGLSVAAVSYYVVGLMAYLTKALTKSRFGALLPAPEIMTGLAVPVVLVVIFLMVRRIRKSHGDTEGHP